MTEQKLTILKTEKRDRTYNPRFETWRQYNAKPRLYVWLDRETLGDNLVNRTTRPHKLYRKHLAEMFNQLGLPAETKARWLQTAGCSCGCSPGFVLDLPNDFEGNRRFDCNVTIGANEATAKDEKGADKRNFRAAQFGIAA